MLNILIKTTEAVETITIAKSDLGFSPPNLNDIITFIIRFLFIVAGLVAILFLILGAISWITAGGNKENVDKAREKIQNAVIGLALVFIVIGIVVLLETILFPDQPGGQKCGLGVSKPICMPKLVQPISN